MAKKVCEKYDSQIEVKIVTNFISFLKHPDSIVIHYANPKSRSEIEKTFGYWLSKFNIRTTPRDYARIEPTRDTKNTSFSDNVAQTAAALMKHNFGKMSNESLAIAGINYAFEMSRVGL